MSFRFSSVEPLAPTHNVAGFDCGSSAQSEWLADHALQAHRAGLSRVYVVRGIEDGLDRVVGYYALAAGSVAPASASARMMRGTGRYHQPIVLLTRLGVDRTVQGVGLGRALVVDALRRIAGAAEVIGVRAALIHCESASARAFYLRLAAFEPSPTDPMHLLLLMKDLRLALSPVAALLAVTPVRSLSDPSAAAALDELRADRF